MISSTAHTRHVSCSAGHQQERFPKRQSKWDIQGESVGWAFVPAWDANEAVVMFQSSEQQVLLSWALFSL